ncbi:hypothetical protein GCM10010329_45070 [Streptomyces spiroverticillatus]|uniref:Uncharacterized protein n=1 Tax=Streptomyces finlayi TaxID=67296 RepID=A0A918WZS7_9ACTN|nr:hypothetical protein GCM10010329_45070 [Streptomyces spiroverticillatus]GHC99075.1 hypothetical protein GCM10010334_42250 [Streptomyces finlayi]
MQGPLRRVCRTRPCRREGVSDDVAEIGAELITAGAAEGILRMVVGAVVRVVRGVVRVVFDS